MSMITNLEIHRATHELGLNISIPADLYIFDNDDDISEAGYKMGTSAGKASSTIKNLHYIYTNPSNKGVVIHLKSSGGDWAEGMAIYDTIKSSPKPTVIINYAEAGSMSSLIFLAAETRVMTPHSTFMIHSGSAEFNGTTKQFATHAKELTREHNVMLTIYADAMANGKGCFKNKSTPWIKKWIQERISDHEEFYMTADEAVEYGLATDVLGKTISWKGIYAND